MNTMKAEAKRFDHNIININALRENGAAQRNGGARKLAAGLIAPAAEETRCELAPEHAAEPIKSMDDIYRISQYLIEHGRYRDNMLFIVGINFGLRASDLRMLRFSNLINENCTFRDSFPVFEKKTRNTRSRKKNRYITINNAVVEAVTLYLEHTSGVCMSDYLFRSVSNHGGNLNEPLSVKSIDRILKGIAAELDLSVKMSTHTLRKTFCYWMMVTGNNDPRRLMLLQKALGHSSMAQTLTYIGLDAEEIAEAYQHLNLGSRGYQYIAGTAIGEREAV